MIGRGGWYNIGRTGRSARKEDDVLEFFCPIPPTGTKFALFSPAFSRFCLLFVIQVRGHIKGIPPPSPLRCLPLFLSRYISFSIFFPRRLAPNCAKARQALSAVIFCTRNSPSSGGAQTREIGLTSHEVYHWATGELVCYDRRGSRPRMGCCACAACMCSGGVNMSSYSSCTYFYSRTPHSGPKRQHVSPTK